MKKYNDDKILVETVEFTLEVILISVLITITLSMPLIILIEYSKY